MNIFANIQFLIKQPQATIIPDCTIWDNITIVVIFDSLHYNFNAIIASIQKYKNKTIKEIQWILASTKAKLISKQVIWMIDDLVMAYREWGFGGGWIWRKRKVFSTEKCFNYRKLSHFKKNCNRPDICFLLVQQKWWETWQWYIKDRTLEENKF